MFRSLSRILAEIGGSSRAAAPRRTALPRVELLENRWVPSTIAGFVFNDVTGSGLYQPGTDPVYANNPITLLDGSGAQIGSTTTDSAGHYSFNVNQTISTNPVALPAETASFGPISTESAGTATVNKFDPTLGTLQSVEIDLTGSVNSNITVQDLNDASLQTQAETFQTTLKGNVNLQAPGASALDAAVQANEPSTTLNAGESHAFDPLQASNSQSVVITDASALAAYIGPSGNPGTVSLNATGDAHVESSGGGGNLATAIHSTISGQVKVIYTYKPSNGLTPGHYTVVQTANPPGTTDGVNSSNGVPVPSGTPHDTIPVTLPPGGDSLQNNFGEVVPAKVSGFVYLDNNKDGVYDAGDAPIPQATVTLSGSTADGAGVISTTTQTAADGSYSFNVPPGTYTITQPDIAGLLDGSDTVGSLGGTAAPDALTVTLPSGANGVNYNFGETPAPPPPPAPATVSGNVYLDVNKDGVFDPGDSPLPQATVNLNGTPSGGGPAISLTTQTAANGSYSFNVPAGTYTITQPDIAGLLDGSDTVGNLGGTAAPDALTVTVPAGANGVNYNFGETQQQAPPLTPPVIPEPPPPTPLPPVPQTPPIISKADFFTNTMWMWGW